MKLAPVAGVELLVMPLKGKGLIEWPVANCSNLSVVVAVGWMLLAAALGESAVLMEAAVAVVRRPFAGAALVVA